MDQWLSVPGRPIPYGPPLSRSNSTRLVRRSSIIPNIGSLAAGLDGLQLPPITSGQVAQFDAAGLEIPDTARDGDDSGNNGITGQDGTDKSCSNGAPTFHLVAFPAKDNYEGQLYPLNWIEQVIDLQGYEQLMLGIVVKGTAMAGATVSLVGMECQSAAS